MTYESWRISFQSSEQAARAAYAEAEALQAEVAQMKRRLILANARKARHKKRAKEFKSELMVLTEALRWAERHCPCGARPESPNTHPHLPGCLVGAALAKEGGE